MSPTPADLIDILLIEDNADDVELTRRALSKAKFANHLSVAMTGEEGLEMLRSPDTPLPDMVLLDLNLPGVDGREVLAEIKSDATLRRIPVVILTTSDDEHDVLKSYDLGANCYITKPVGLRKFMSVVDQIEGFWFGVVRLPPKP